MPGDVKLPQVVIVGGGFGGLRTAKRLGGAPVQVTLIDRTNHHLFQPLLYQVATAGLSPGDITAPLRHVLRDQHNTEVLMAEVTAVDTENRRVVAGELSIPYDYLVLATGARESYFGHEEWCQYAPAVKTIGDTTAVRSEILLAFERAESEAAAAEEKGMEPDQERLDQLLTFVLIGAGPTGVEMSGAIAEMAHQSMVGDFQHIHPEKARIVLLEAAPRMLGMFPEPLAKKAQEALEQRGVEVRLNQAVEKVDEDGVVAGGERIRTRNIIWTAGVAASPAGKWIGADVDRAGRVKVQPDLSAPGHPEIFVIGDTATLEWDGKPMPGLAPVAMQEGEYVAGVIRSRIEGEAAPPPFHYRHKGNLATVGRSFAIFHLGPLQLTGFLAWVLWLVVHIFFLIDFRNRLVVIFQWAWAYFTSQRAIRLITPQRQP